MRYYVNNGGNDRNPGTEAAPWQTIDRVNRGPFQPTDEILFAGEQMFGGNVRLTSVGLTMGSYGGGRAILHAGSGNGIEWTGPQNTTIKDLVITATGALNAGTGISLTAPPRSDGWQGDTWIVIDNVEICGFAAHNVAPALNGPGQGLNIQGIGDSGLKLKLTNSVVHDCEDEGINTYGVAYLTIENVDAYDNPGRTHTDYGTGGGIGVGGPSQGGSIRNCRAWGNGANLTGTQPGCGGIGIGMCHGITIENCLAWSNKAASGNDGDGFFLDNTRNCSIVNCRAWNNDGAGIVIGALDGPPNESSNAVIDCWAMCNNLAKKGYQDLNVYSVEAGSIVAYGRYGDHGIVTDTQCLLVANEFHDPQPGPLRQRIRSMRFGKRT